MRSKPNIPVASCEIENTPEPVTSSPVPLSTAERPDRRRTVQAIKMLRMIGVESHHFDLLDEPGYLFQSLMDRIPDMVYFKDTQSCFLWANHAVAHHFGQNNPIALLGKTDFDFFANEHARLVRNDELMILCTGEPLIDVEEREIWPDRPDTWVLSSKLPLYDKQGTIIGIFGISRDITERKRAEDQMREQARLLNLVGDAVVVSDMDDAILFWNAAAERIYGWSAQEVVGQKARQFPQTDTIKYQQAKETVMEKGKWSGEFSVHGRDGKALVVEAHWVLVRDPAGKAKSILGISTDVTQKRELEVQTLRSQRMESLGTLAGGIAHDLNNVLTPLLLSVQMLKEPMAADDHAKLLDALEVNVLRGAKLVKQVLAFGRGVKGDRAPVQLALVIREIEQMIRETFPKSIDLDIQFATDLWQVIGDVTQLYQVLLNLSVNARDAMPNGGKLSIGAKNVTLTTDDLRLKPEARPGSYVMIVVQDSGTGISPAIQEKMFEPFFTTKEPGNGTGLGLSTCRGIVKSHGGFINCDSEVGEGTIFKVYLPAERSLSLAPRSSPKPPRPLGGRGELVLVVDDEEVIRMVAREALEAFGYRVLTATNGAEAIKAFEMHLNEIAVVVTDIAMPIMDGETAIKAMRARNPQVKIIYASGLEVVRKKFTGDRQHFLSKPYTAQALLETLHKALEGKVS